MKRSKNNKNFWTKINFLKFVLDGLLIIGFTFLLSYLTTLSGYYPMENNDFLANASRTRFMIDNWPNINWNHEWGSGMPFFLWYAPFPFLFIILFSKLFSNIELGLGVITVLSFAFMGIGIYGIVYEVTRKRLLSLFSAFLSISLPAYWYRILVGTVPRIISTALMMISLWLLIKFLRNYYENKQKINKKIFVVLLISLALSLQNHIFIAVMTGFFVTLIIFIGVRGLKEKIKMFFKILSLPLLLSSYFLFPFFATLYHTILLGKQSIGIYHAPPAILELYLFHRPEILVIHGGGLSPLVLPLVIVFLLAVLFGRLTKGDYLGQRVIISFFILTCVFILFGLAIYLGYPANWYSVNFPPDEGFYFLALVTPVLLGILFYYIFGQKRLLYYLTLGLLFISLGLFVWWQYPQRNEYSFYDKDSYVVSQENIEISPISELVKNDLEEKQYRLAHPATEIALFFNYIYDIPQTRDFFAQGNLYPDWRAWLENALWEWEDNYDEVNFLLDWYGIKWFVVSSPIGIPPNVEKYEKRLDFYELKVKAAKEKHDLFTRGVYGELHGFVFKDASPILSATNAPTLLIVGTKKQNKSYDPVLRDLALLDINSQHLIPIRGKEYIDDYKIDELKKFRALILYEYKIHNINKAISLLNDYLEQDGGLVIEKSEFLSIDQQSQLLEGLMGLGLKEVLINKDWQFQPREHFLTQNIDFSQFSEALYMGSPWKVNVAKNKKIEAENILTTQDEPVVVAKELDKGRIVFSGLNLPYHIRNNNQLNLEETKFLVNMFKWVLRDNLEKAKAPDYEAGLINPEKREVVIQNEAQGVLFKENYFFNWQAYLETNGKKEKLKIYPAGVDFMYVPLPDFSQSGKLVLQYRKSWLENISLIVTIIVGLGFVIYIFEGWLFKPILPRLYRISLGKLVKNTKKWWAKEDEE